jgi:phosphoheptose isomerase
LPASLPDSSSIRELVSLTLREGIRTQQALLAACTDDIARAAALARATLAGGHKLVLCGNGGSAADAQHIAAELVGRFLRERAPLPAVALTVDSSILTAVGNDYGFEQIFARQVRALGEPGDLLVAISTSGRSPNVLEAVKAARARGLAVVGLTGQGQGRADEGGDNRLSQMCDVCVRVPSRVTSRIQECHIAIGHILCETVDAVTLDVDEQPAPPPAVRFHDKHLSLGEAVRLRAIWKARGLTVAWTNGCFDVVHAGHAQSLAAARAHGDLLVVGVNSDDSVRALKGAGRPVFPIADRVAVLGALGAVDHVVVFDETTPERVLGELRPDVHCKGADYAPPDGAPIPEAKLVASYGGRLAFLPLIPGLSSTAAIAAMKGSGS